MASVAGYQHKTLAINAEKDAGQERKYQNVTQPLPSRRLQGFPLQCEARELTSSY